MLEVGHFDPSKTNEIETFEFVLRLTKQLYRSIEDVKKNKIHFFQGKYPERRID